MSLSTFCISKVVYQLRGIAIPKSGVMLSLSDQEFKTVMDAAATLPQEKRGVFLQRLDAMMKVHGFGVQAAVDAALQGLQHNQAAGEPTN